MKKIRDSVIAVICYKNEVFVIKRQNYLRAFPGYTTFPGGKVDPDDDAEADESPIFKPFPNDQINALIREMKEELELDLLELEKEHKIHSVHEMGVAITPDFNPIRFTTYFYKIVLNEKIEINALDEEAESFEWIDADKLKAKYDRGEVLCVPPTFAVIKALADDAHCTEVDLRFEYDQTKYVPIIESLKGVRQAMPLSNTLFPATRTNCFIIGDVGENILLMDPSPKDEAELQKLINSISQFNPTHIFLSHHHWDHHEYAPDLARKLGLKIFIGDDAKKRIESKWGTEYFSNIDVHIISDEEVLTKSLGVEVKTYATPGHDEGQFGLAPVDQRWFIVGDLFQGIGTVVVGGEEGDMSKYFHSLQRVIAMDPKVVFPSHGIGLGSTHILQKTLEHRQMREDQVLELTKQGKSKDEILKTLYYDIPEKLYPYAMANIDSHLEKLKIEKKL